MSSSKTTLARFKNHLSFQTIGPDKVNQLRHVAFFKDFNGLMAHMDKHAAVMKPRFDAVLETLDRALKGTGMGTWIVPEGGYFVSFETRPGLAKTVVALAGDAGIKLTPAGATFPYGNDTNDSNIRIAPSFPSIADVQATMDAFVLCVRLATLRALAGKP
jgi:DNA-binding transcriptional MocR family regulator